MYIHRLRSALLLFYIKLWFILYLFMLCLSSDIEEPSSLNGESDIGVAGNDFSILRKSKLFISSFCQIFNQLIMNYLIQCKLNIIFCFDKWYAPNTISALIFLRLQLHQTFDYLVSFISYRKKEPTSKKTKSSSRSV